MKKYMVIRNSEEKLHIKNIRENRNGYYKCRAVSAMGTDTHDVELTVECKLNVFSYLV